MLLSLLSLFLCLLSWMTPAAAAPIPVDAVVAGALAHDPAVAHAMAACEAAQGELRSATGLRENPSLEVRIGIGAARHEFSLTQPVSLSGAGAAAAAEARFKVSAAEARLERQRLETATYARILLVRAIQADETLALAQESLALMRTLRGAAEARLLAGEGTGLEVQLTRLEEAAATATALSASREAADARVALIGLTGLPLDVELPRDLWVAVPAPASAVSERSDLRADRLLVEAASARISLERASVLPPVGIGVWAEADPGGGAWALGPSLSLTLPVWQQNAAGRAEASAALAMASAELSAARARADADQAAIPGQRAVATLAGDLASPAIIAREALGMIEKGVEAGELGVMDAALLRARVMDAWVRSAGVRAEAAFILLSVALQEEWSTLL